MKRPVTITKLRRVIHLTAKIMERVSVSGPPLRRDVKRFLEQHAKWLREQVK